MAKQQMMHTVKGCAVDHADVHCRSRSTAACKDQGRGEAQNQASASSMEEAVQSMELSRYNPQYSPQVDPQCSLNGIS